MTYLRFTRPTGPYDRFANRLKYSGGAKSFYQMLSEMDAMLVADRHQFSRTLEHELVLTFRSPEDGGDDVTIVLPRGTVVRRQPRSATRYFRVTTPGGSLLVVQYLKHPQVRERANLAIQPSRLRVITRIGHRRPRTIQVYGRQFICHLYCVLEILDELCYNYT